MPLSPVLSVVLVIGMLIDMLVVAPLTWVEQQMQAYLATHSSAVNSSQPSSSGSSPGTSTVVQLTAKDIQDIARDIASQVARKYPNSEITEEDIEELVRQIAARDSTLSKEQIETIAMQLIDALGGGYFLAGLTMQQIIKIFIQFTYDNQSGEAIRWSEATVVIGLIIDGTITLQFDKEGEISNLGRPAEGDFTYDNQTYDIKQCYNNWTNRPLTPSEIENMVLKDFGQKENSVLDVRGLDTDQVEQVKELARQLVEGHPDKTIWIWDGSETTILP